MKKIKTLKKNYEFQRVLTKGKFYIGKQITIYIMKNYTNVNIIGIAVSTKASKAVGRNRIKRLIRENYRLLKDKIKTGHNIVFLWNNREIAQNADFRIIEKDMNKLLKKAELL